MSLKRTCSILRSLTSFRIERLRYAKVMEISLLTHFWVREPSQVSLRGPHLAEVYQVQTLPTKLRIQEKIGVITAETEVEVTLLEVRTRWVPAVETRAVIATAIVL